MADDDETTIASFAVGGTKEEWLAALAAPDPKDVEIERLKARERSAFISGYLNGHSDGDQGENPSRDRDVIGGLYELWVEEMNGKEGDPADRLPHEMSPDEPGDEGAAP